jgi:hypothetical protein
MGHQGVQAPCFKYVCFAYNYAYPRVYISKIRISNSYISKICIPRYIYPGYTYPIYIYLEYVYIRNFTYLRYICQKNNIPRVYIHLCPLGMCKSYIPQGMYKTSRILYILSMVPRHLGALVILPIFKCIDI